MKLALNTMVQLAVCLFFVSSLTTQAQEAKPDATGTWSWTREGRNGGEPRKSSLALKAEGVKLTGKLTSPGRQGGEPRITEISDGKVKDDEISFNITRQRQTNTFVTTYTGKVSGDSITGTIAFDRNGETRSREWTAKREAAPAKE